MKGRCVILSGSVNALNGRDPRCRHVCIRPAEHDGEHLCECDASWQPRVIGLDTMPGPMKQ